MGYMRHHAIIVTSWEHSHLEAIHTVATNLFQKLVSPIGPEVTNGYRSFYIQPDGSKEGWERSVEMDDKREDFIKELNSRKLEDGSSYLDWVEVQFGDDECNDIVIRSSKLERLKGREK